MQGSCSAGAPCCARVLLCRGALRAVLCCAAVPALKGCLLSRGALRAVLCSAAVPAITGCSSLQHCSLALSYSLPWICSNCPFVLSMPEDSRACLGSCVAATVPWRTATPCLCSEPYAAAAAAELRPASVVSLTLPQLLLRRSRQTFALLCGLGPDGSSATTGAADGRCCAE